VWYYNSTTSYKANKTAIVASTDPGELDFTRKEKEEQQVVYMAKCCRQKAHWEVDENIKEACNLMQSHFLRM
jgi:hypothetical protein